MDYLQPDFYRFNQDSLLFSKFVHQQEKAIGRKRLLDMGCGCGIIAIELANMLNSLQDIWMIEYQINFKEFIEYNLDHFLERKLLSTVGFQSIKEFSPAVKFDLIVSNPPYFSKGEGRTSPSESKQICRTFEVDSLKDFLVKGIELLDKEGVFYCLIREDQKDWMEMDKNLKNKFRVVKRLGVVSVIFHANI